MGISQSPPGGMAVTSRKETRSDARRLTEARLELVSHAHNYSSGTIELDGHVDRSMHPPCLVPTVSDQGPGIPTAMQDDILGRFLRRNVEASTGASCGRGLSIEKPSRRTMDWWLYTHIDNEWNPSLGVRKGWAGRS